ncbi:MAG: hypothetical protein WBH75_20315 [Thermoanaerobaculia bacterium]
MLSVPVTLKTPRGGGVVLLATALLFFALAGAEAALYREGEQIEVRGVVTDSEGMPIPDLTVNLEIARYAFDWKKFRKTRHDVNKATTTTDLQGAYAFEWTWYDYYNDFQLIVGLMVRDPDLNTEVFQTLHRENIAPRVGQGSPVVVDLVASQSPFLDTQPGVTEPVVTEAVDSEPLESPAVDTSRDSAFDFGSEDEKRIYDEMGRPNKVQTLEYPEYDEVTWWYFEQGKAYRFREGELQQVVNFDPVTPIDPN